MFNDIYKNKKVLITGHTGFKGSWLTAWLNKLGAHICGYSLYLPSDPCHFAALNLAHAIHHVMGDVRDYDHLKKTITEFKPDIVFHMAAQPIVRSSYIDPKETFDINAGGVVNILDIIKDAESVKAGVIITSDKCYENTGQDVAYKEDDLLGGADPYSASKACAEIIFSSYYRSFFQNGDRPKIATARAGNVIGGGDWAKDRIVPDCVKAWSQQQSPVIRKPEATRPWQHVLEPLSGYLWLGASLLAGEKNITGHSYNFGPNSAEVKSVGELADLFLKYWGDGQWTHEPLEGDMKEATLLKLNIDKAGSHLRWAPALDFEATIAMTAQWYKAFYDNNKLNVCDVTESQIKTYVEHAREKGLAWVL